MPMEAPSAEEKIRVDEIVSAIQSKQAERDAAVLLVDESHFSNEPYVQRGGQRVKSRRKAHQPKIRQSKTIFGALVLESPGMYSGT